MSPDMQAIVQRLEELEKQVAHLAALVTEQSDPDRTVAARCFALRDERGRGRATLESTTTGPCLGLFDADGSLRACIGVAETTTSEDEGPYLMLYSKAEKKVAEIREYQNGPSLAFFDANGSPRMVLIVKEDGSFAYLYSPNGKQNVRLELFSGGQASLVMQAPNGEPRFLLAVDESSRASIAFLKDNNVLWTAP